MSTLGPGGGPSLPGGAITVVVADDEPHVVDYLCTVLHLEGFVVVGTAHDAGGAVSEVDHLHPDVAVLDQNMPGGGLQAAQMIGALSPNTRIVIFSSAADEVSVMPLLRVGIDGFVLKGSPPDRIGDAVRSAVEGRAYLAPAVSQVAMDALAERLHTEELEDLRRRRDLDQIDDLIAQRRFATVVQPIVDLTSRRPVAVEALTRFSALPARTPAEWFALAEQVGREVPLELAVSRAALQTIDWLPPPLSIAVNVSSSTVMSGRLAEILIDRPMDRVVLEITEHAPVEDYGALLGELRPWRERGAQLAVDDVGAGYASFAHVLRLRPEVIKLDIELVRDIHTDPPRRAMARAVAGYAREMGIVVAAEGIETEAEAGAMADLGVTLGQGFHLGRPRPLAEQLEALSSDAASPESAEVDLREGAARPGRLR